MNNPTHPPSPPPAPFLPSPASSQGFWRILWTRAGSKPGAKGAMAWIGLISLLAILAPYLASSFPYLVKTTDGHWSSPLLMNLSPLDVWLPSAAIWLVVVLVRSIRRRWLGIGWLLLAAICWSLVRPPINPIYDRYREMQRQGEAAFILRAPIPYSPSDRMGDLFDAENFHPQPPSARHWQGTEINGADIASRLIHACRIAMSVGFVSTGIAVVVGILIGGLMGYFSGWGDLIGMRLVEVFSAIPRMFLLLALIALWPDESTRLYLMMAIIGLTGWSGYALFLRAEFLKLRKQEFVQAAIASGLPLRSILFRHMLPNGITPVLVSASFGIAGGIAVENMLSFLGVGLVEQPSWGGLLAQAVLGTSFHWWLAIFPGGMLVLTTFSYILIGQSLRDALDAKQV